MGGSSCSSIWLVNSLSIQSTQLLDCSGIYTEKSGVLSPGPASRQGSIPSPANGLSRDLWDTEGPPISLQSKSMSSSMSRTSRGSPAQAIPASSYFPSEADNAKMLHSLPSEPALPRMVIVMQMIALFQFFAVTDLTPASCSRSTHDVLDVPTSCKTRISEY